MRIAKWIVAMSLLVGLTAAFAVEWTRHVAEEELANANASALVRLNRYCWEVRFALEDDASDFESSNLPRQRAALWRIQSARTLHSQEDISLCTVTDATALDADACAEREDFACMAKLVRVALASWPPDPSWHRVPERALPQLTRFCRSVQTNLRAIGRQLQSDDPLLQAPAAEALLDDQIGRSEREVQLCSGDPPSYFDAVACKVDGKYHCLAELAFSASNRIYIPGETTP